MAHYMVTCVYVIAHLPIAVPSMVDRVTTTVLSKDPCTATVTVTLPARSVMEYVAGLNPIVTTEEGGEL